ncbi:MAG: polysaccharide deacetylase family protein [Oscillospiraceae bacterium]|jgi:hypothetical protein
MKKKRDRSFLLLILAVLMLFSACGKESGKADGTASSKKKSEKEETLESTLEKAETCAKTYDYDAAINTLTSYDSNWESNETLSKTVSSYQEQKEELVRVDASTIPHIFFHSLIADTDRAFDGDYDSGGYNQYMATVDEFETILQQMYDNGYVLVSIYDVAPKVTFIDGTTQYKPGMIMLPKGKKPFVMSQDDVNYYEYMTDSDEDHIADKGGDGFATKLVIDENGDPTCEYITADGKVVTGNYDLVPVLEDFIKEHPDFSYRGARAILAVTGYDGVLGYRTASKYKDILSSKDYKKEVEEAKKVAECLKEHGYIICSHSFGHPAYGSISDESLAKDCAQWEEEVQPIVGDTDILLYPYGSDIAGIEDYSGFKFETLYNAGYRYFCNVDSAPSWLQIHDNYVRQARRNIDGYRMYYTPNLLDDLFDTDTVFDPARPDPVPPI